MISLNSIPLSLHPSFESGMIGVKMQEKEVRRRNKDAQLRIEYQKMPNIKFRKPLKSMINYSRLRPILLV